MKLGLIIAISLAFLHIFPKNGFALLIIADTDAIDQTGERERNEKHSRAIYLTCVWKGGRRIAIGEES